MDSNEYNDLENDFNLICPECGVGNLNSAQNCIVCDKELTHTLEFLEDDSFDLEVTEDLLIEYRKSFWGTERTGKVNKYELKKLKNIEFGSPISRLIFEYEGKRIVLPLKEENMKKIKQILEN